MNRRRFIQSASGLLIAAAAPISIASPERIAADQIRAFAEEVKARTPVCRDGVHRVRVVHITDNQALTHRLQGSGVVTVSGRRKAYMGVECTALSYDVVHWNEILPLRTGRFPCWHQVDSELPIWVMGVDT